MAVLLVNWGARIHRFTINIKISATGIKNLIPFFNSMLSNRTINNVENIEKTRVLYTKWVSNHAVPEMNKNAKINQKNKNKLASLYLLKVNINPKIASILITGSNFQKVSIPDFIPV